MSNPYDTVIVERAENGYVIRLCKKDEPDSPNEKKEILGVPIAPEDTLVAIDRAAVVRILRNRFFNDQQEEE